MALDKAIHQAIRNSERNLSLDPKEDELDAIDAEIFGETDTTDPADFEGVNGDTGAMPLADAIEIQRLATNTHFQHLVGAQTTLQSQFVEKSKDESKSADYRTLFHNKALGIEQAVALICATIGESAARIKAATPQERRAMGGAAVAPVTELKTPIIVDPASLEETPSDEPFIVQGHVVNSLGGMNVVAAEFVPRRSE